MSRYRGPRLKRVRRFQQQLPGLTSKSAERRPYPPGQHGTSRRGKPSDYRVRLSEKQKLRFNYGITERQLRKYFARAAATPGDSGLNLLVSLESRLDNVVFRASFANTIPGARQLVAHGHVTVNGRRCDVASYQVKVGDVIGLREKSRKIQTIVDNLAAPTWETPSYLAVESDKFQAVCSASPTRDDVLLDVQETLIVEHFSR